MAIFLPAPSHYHSHTFLVITFADYSSLRYHATPTLRHRLDAEILRYYRCVERLVMPPFAIPVPRHAAAYSIIFIITPSHTPRLLTPPAAARRRAAQPHHHFHFSGRQRLPGLHASLPPPRHLAARAIFRPCRTFTQLQDDTPQTHIFLHAQLHAIYTDTSRYVLLRYGHT